MSVATTKSLIQMEKENAVQQNKSQLCKVAANKRWQMAKEKKKKINDHMQMMRNKKRAKAEKEEKKEEQKEEQKEKQKEEEVPIEDQNHPIQQM